MSEAFLCPMCNKSQDDISDRLATSAGMTRVHRRSHRDLIGVCSAYLFIQATQVVPDLLFELLSLSDPKHGSFKSLDADAAFF